MKISDKQKAEYKIARSKERVKTRNAWKVSRKALQGAKMIISEEEKEAREKSGKKPITPKKWKEELYIRKNDTVNNKSTEPKSFYCEELKARRKAKRARLKALKAKRNSMFIPQKIKYPKFKSYVYYKICSNNVWKIELLMKKFKAKVKTSLKTSKDVANVKAAA